MKSLVHSLCVLVWSVLISFDVSGASRVALDESLQYTEGQINQAMLGRCSYANDVISPSAGTIQCWLSLTKSPSDMQYSHIWGLGHNRAGWFTTFIDNGKLSVLSKTENGNSVVGLDVSNWQRDKWYNIAISWGTYRKKSYILLYEDGVLKAKYDNVHLPQKFNGDDFCVGFNSANRNKDNFFGKIDELVITKQPMLPDIIALNVKKGKQSQNLSAQPDVIFLAHFDSNTTFDIGKNRDWQKKELKKHLKKALKLPVIKKYADEIDATYYYDQEVKEKTLNVLMDGSDKTLFTWKQHPLEIVIDLPYTADLSLIEISAPKPTIWYHLDELNISLDNGSGEFLSFKTIKTYGEDAKQTKNIIDDTCKDYIYQWQSPGKASRIKIVPKGIGYMALGEIRVCGKPVQ